MSPTLAAAWLVAKVSNSPALAGLAGRVYPDAAPEGAPNPCLIYQLLDHEEDEQLDAGEIRDSSPGFQLRIYAATRMEENALREAA
ncbi:MAG: hypothetical protein JWO82_2500 [Akkermansiaceae bacterium]|nr:hypothetical protein [Akkermansiaceae bacterium]